MRHTARLAKIERRAQLRTGAQDAHLQVFAQTAGAAAAFRRRYGHEPTRADIWRLVNDAIPIAVNGAVVVSGVMEVLEPDVDYRRGLAAIAPREGEDYAGKFTIEPDEPLD